MLARANSGEAQIDRGKASRIVDSALLHVEGATSDLGRLADRSNQPSSGNRGGDRGVRSKARRDDGLRRHRGIVDLAEEYAAKSRVEPRKRMERRETPHAPSAQGFIIQPKNLRRSGNRTKRGCELFSVDGSRRSFASPIVFCEFARIRKSGRSTQSRIYEPLTRPQTGVGDRVRETRMRGRSRKRESNQCGRVHMATCGHERSEGATRRQAFWANGSVSLKQGNRNHVLAR